MIKKEIIKSDSNEAAARNWLLHWANSNQFGQSAFSHQLSIESVVTRCNPIRFKHKRCHRWMLNWNRWLQPESKLFERRINSNFKTSKIQQSLVDCIFKFCSSRVQLSIKINLESTDAWRYLSKYTRPLLSAFNVSSLIELKLNTIPFSPGNKLLINPRV